jgi:hypothetical protein
VNQWSDDVHLELPADIACRNVEGRTALADTGVVHQDFDVPRQRLLAVSGIGDVQLLDLEADPRSAAWRFKVCT